MPAAPQRSPPHSARALGLSPNGLQLWLGVAGVGCCVAMAMPQVHIVAYCVDLGYGTARGAEMLSIMTVFGIMSRLGSGWIADRIGGIKTLLLGSTAAGGRAAAATSCRTGWSSLYVVSALFGLVQGGIIPSYGVIVREYFPPQGSRRPHGHRHLAHHRRHGAGRLDGRRAVRPHRLLSRRLPQRHRLERC